jgi:hypothetical protein
VAKPVIGVIGAKKENPKLLGDSISKMPRK